MAVAEAFRGEVRQLKQYEEERQIFRVPNPNNVPPSRFRPLIVTLLTKG